MTLSDMLFYLTDSLITETGASDFRDVYNAVDNILKAHEERRHIVLGDIGVLTWYMGFFNNDNPRYGTLLNLIDSYATNTIPTEITEYIKVVKSVASESQEVNGRKVYNVPFNKFISSSSLQSTMIIGEDENDSKMYEQIFRWYKVTRKYPYNVKMTYEAGGGFNTFRKVKNLSKNKNIFVCIVDTDQRYPGCKHGDTCSECENLTYEPPTERLHVISAHEIENLIPKSILDELEWETPRKPAKRCYDKISENLPNDNDSWRYIDLKSGITKHIVYKNDPDWVEFVKAIYNTNPDHNNEFDNKFKNASDKEIIMTGLSKTLLSESLKYITAKPDTELKKISGFLDFQLREWNKIGQTILNTCISSSSEACNY